MSDVRTPESRYGSHPEGHSATQRTPPPAATPPTQNAHGAITKVRDMIETIEKRETHIQRKIDNEITQAKKFSAAGKKREALQCIKRKKMYEKQHKRLEWNIGTGHPMAYN